MAFTGTITKIDFINDNFRTVVMFADSTTGWMQEKVYFFAPGTSQAAAQIQITTDGTAYKANLAQNTTLQSRVGTVITIWSLSGFNT